MSFAGIVQFKENLDRLMESEAFKNADDGQKMVMGTRLLRSKYGTGSLVKGKVSSLQKIERDK